MWGTIIEKNKPRGNSTVYCEVNKLHVPYIISTIVRLKRSWRARRHSFPSHSNTGLRSSMNTFSDNCFCVCANIQKQSKEKEKEKHQRKDIKYYNLLIDISIWYLLIMTYFINPLVVGQHIDDCTTMRFYWLVKGHLDMWWGGTGSGAHRWLLYQQSHCRPT